MRRITAWLGAISLRVHIAWWRSKPYRAWRHLTRPWRIARWYEEDQDALCEYLERKIDAVYDEVREVAWDVEDLTHEVRNVEAKTWRFHDLPEKVEVLS